MKKQATYEEMLSRLRAPVKAAREILQKKASLGTEQGFHEAGSVPAGTSDPEVKDMTLGGNPGHSPKTLTNTGCELGEKVPGTPAPSETKEKIEEVSTGSKLAELASRFPKLAAFLERMFARPSFKAIIAEEAPTWTMKSA